MDEKRFYFDSDDDGHDYLIPLELKEEFQSMFEACFSLPWGFDGYYEEIDKFEKKFREYRIGQSISNYSFIDPVKM